ncbi:MAG: RHS repeat-associated core domain-containing protein [Solirubrobacterales bacterium]
MKFVMPRFAAGSLCCLVGLLGCSGLAHGGTPPALVDSPPLSGALVVPGSPVEAEQREAEEQARRSSPEAAAARATSVTKYESLDTAQAATLAREVFPSVISRREGGPPALLAGQHIAGYVTPNIADVETGSGQHGVVESTAPMATKSASGWSPVDLSLSPTGDGFAAANPLLRLRIPKHASDGIELPERAVSMTPVDPVTGSSLGSSEGVLDGAAILYANTQTDTDTAVKPLVTGFEATSILRSAQSPQQLAFKIGVPPGASLKQEGGSPVQVVKEGQVLATISVPEATDAEGALVPVVTSIAGNTLVLEVDHRDAGYQYPIAVDPRATDTAIRLGVAHSNWAYATDDTNVFHEEESFGAMLPSVRYVEGSSYAPGEYAYFVYHTQGRSHIDAFAVGAVEHDYNFEGGIAVGNSISVASPHSGNEGTVGLSTWTPFPDEERVVCTDGSCEPRPITVDNQENRAYFEVHTLESRHEYFLAEMLAASVYIGQEVAPSTGFDSTDATLNGGPNAGNGQWVNTTSTSSAVLGVNAEDQGIGINAAGAKSPNKTGWGYAPREVLEGECAGVQCNECDKGECPGIVVKHGKPLSLYFSSLGELPDGEDTVEETVQDGAGLSATATGKVRVDNTAPHGLTLAGLPSGNEIGEGGYTIKAEATDGAGTTLSSGVSSLAIAVDGREIGKPTGSCPVGPCVAKGEWLLSGSETGVGEHKLTLTATDAAGNVAVETYSLNVHHAPSLGVGPGSVNAQSGDFGVRASDVSVAAPGAPLMVERSYHSRHIAGAGPLGPQWSLSVGGQESITTWFGRATLKTAAGGEVTFTSSGGGKFTAPPGDANLALTEVTSGGVTTEYVLRDASDAVTTHFTPSGTMWKATKQEGALASQTARYIYQTVEGVTEPTYALAPEPAGLGYSCIARLEKAESLEKGCRALAFKYASSTTATGENQSEWNAYKGHLEQVSLVAYNPATKAMATTSVAQYIYDNKGRLRAEWDPRVSPALKTVYGYDEEGHLTALTPPGEESWAFAYGTSSGDASLGRLLKVTRAPASAPLWDGHHVEHESAPTLTGATVVGVAMGVSVVNWSHNPVVFGFQWERCSAEGANCVVIPGATNGNYTLTEGDVGHRMAALVTATNGGGTQTVVATGGGVVTATGTKTQGNHREPEPGSTIEYGVPTSGTGLPTLTAAEAAKWGQADDPVEGVAIFPPDEAMGWPAKDYKRATISYWDTHGNTVNTANPGGGVATSEYNASHDVVRTLGADNRAVALKESCESTEKCKSAEVAKLLDNENTYNEGGSEPGTELLSTLGPQHTVELTNRTQAEARTHTVYSYNEGQPSEGGPYHLVTKTTQGAQISGKEEPESVRTVTTSYSGQGGLGWTLRKATSTTTDPAGLDLVHKTIYDPTTGNVTEMRSPTGNSETIYPPAFAAAFASEGSGNGQLNEPRGVATDASGNIWVVDQNNNRIEKFSSARTWIASYGTKGTGNLQFEKPWGIAINQSTGNVYVADRGNNRIEELSSSGTWVANFGTSGESTLKEPTGVALDVSGNLFVSDKANNRVVEFGPTGTFIRAFGTLGSGNGQLSAPLGIAISEGSVYVVDSANSRVEQFSSIGSYIGQFGSNGAGAGQFKEAVGIAANPSSGVLYVADLSNSRISEFSPAGRLLTEWGTWGPKHENSSPNNVAVAANGTLYDSNLHSGQVLSWTPPEAGAAKLNYNSQFGSSGSGNGQFSSPKYTALDGEGNVWATDCGNNRIEKFSAKGAFIAAYGKAGSGEVQFSCPTGIDINQSTGNVYVSDSENHRIEQLTSAGAYVRSFGTSGSCTLTKPGGLKIETSSGNVWVPDLSANKICEFSSSGAYVAAYGSEGSGEVQFKKPVAIAFSGANLYVTDELNHRVEELSNTGAYIRAWGIEGKGSGEFYAPEGIANDGAGNLYVVDDGAAHVEEFTSAGVYRGTFGTGGSGEGQLKGPVGDMIDAAGNLYVVDNENNRVQKWSSFNPAVHDSQAIYYSAAGEAGIAECRNHPEWANLPCLTKPVAQPKTTGLPELAVTEHNSYNMWEEPELTTEHFGVVTRTATATYDAAGRAKTTATSSTEGVALPTITYSYTAESGAETGQLTSQSITIEGKTKKVTNVFDTLGEIASYTDADGNTSTDEYDVDGRTKNINDGRGTQTYTYSATSGLLSELVDSSAEGMKFTASYDADGKLLTEGYPSGMNANYTYSPTGDAIALEYKKTTHCTEEHEKCKWFTDSVIPSIHGQWVEQTSTLSHQAYTYDADGRLSQVQNTPTGQGCTTRVYRYDEETNRTGLTTREPAAEGKCATEGGTTEAHIYDEADRLIDPGVTYSAFGDTTTLPPGDAGGSALTSAYYVNDQLQSQTQNGETISYNLDPAGRTRETVSTGKTASTIVSHYAGSGDSPAWTVNLSGEAIRSISGVDGYLAAIQKGVEPPVLQLTNLHGDVVATASKNESATELASKVDTSEFGVPTVTTPPPYSWLGGDELPTELSTGIAAMGVRSYVPQLGRFLQTDPVPGGSANSYSYTFGDPVDTSDPSGEYTIELDEFDESYENEQAAAAAAARAAEIRAAEEAAARAEAEERAAQAAQEAELARILGEGAGLVVEGGGNSGGGCSGTRACVAVGGCPSIHDPCYPKNGMTTAPTLEHSSRCRSGKEYHDRCVVNRSEGPSASECATERKIVFGGGFTGLISKAAGVVDLFASTLVAQRCGI